MIPSAIMSAKTPRRTTTRFSARLQFHPSGRSRILAIVLAVLFATATQTATVPTANAAARETSPNTAAVLDGVLKMLGKPEAAPVPITLFDAVRLAVSNHPAIRARASVAERAELTEDDAASVLEPVLTSSFVHEDSQSPVASGLQATRDGVTGERETLDRNTQSAEISVGKRLLFGGQLDMSLSSVRSDTNAVFSRLAPEHRPTLSLELTRPLMRDRSGIEARSLMELAETDSERAMALFEEEVASFVYTAVEAYWDTVQAKLEVEVSERALALAEELVREARHAVAVGVLAPVAIKEAQAEAASRREELLRAENTARLMASSLQHIVLLGIESGNSPTPLIPYPHYEPEEAKFDLRERIGIALERRPEVTASKLDLDRALIDERRAKDATLPAIDLIAGFDVSGLAGSTVRDDPDEPDDPFEGGLGDALSDAFGANYPSYRIGVQMQIPLANDGAKSRHAQRQAESRRAARALEETVLRVALDVRTSTSDVESAFERVGVARLARSLAEENLEAQQKRYEVGAVATKVVLDFQRNLSAAMAAEAAALTDHAKATARLAQVEGRILSHFNVEIPRPEQSTRAWYTKF